MPDLKHEIAQAVYTMLEALTVFQDRKDLTAPIDRAADDFNALLAGAQQSLSDSPLLRRIAPLRAEDSVVVLIARLAVLKAGIDSALIRLHGGDLLRQTYQYWRHDSGMYFAIELRRGKVWASCGPLALSDLDPQLLRYLPYQGGEMVQWIDEHRGEFTVSSGR